MGLGFGPAGQNCPPTLNSLNSPSSVTHAVKIEPMSPRFCSPEAVGIEKSNLLWGFKVRVDGSNIQLLTLISG